MGKYGAGTAYQKPDGTWCAQWSAGRDEYGHRIRGTTSGHPTEAAARKAMADARARSSSGKRRRGGPSVAAFLARWLDEVVRPTRRERTYWGYRSIVEHHLLPAFGDLPLAGLTDDAVQRWVNRQKAAPNTIRHRLDCLRSAMSYAKRRHLVDVNPAKDIDLPPLAKRRIRAMSEDDVRAIQSAVENEWFAPLVTVALYTGIRQGELLGLRWEDVDADTIHVRRSLARLPGRRGTRYVLDAPKSASSVRDVPLAGPVADLLRERRKESLAGAANPHGLVFARPDGRPIDGTTLTHDFQDSLKAAGLPVIRWHDLRHATASRLIADGVPLAVVSAILGHSGIAITVDTYGHLGDAEKRAALGNMAAKMAATR